MASIIKSDNGVSSGITGIVQSADSSGQLALQTTTSGGTATTAVTVDNAQNVGVGVTPSTWSSGKAIEIGFVGNGVFGLANNNFLITQNAYYNSGFKYASGSSLPSSYYQQTNGTHAWGIAGSGTAGNAITYTTAMSLDNNGNLLVGTANTNPAASGVNGTVILANGGIRNSNGGSASYLAITTSSGTQLNFYTYSSGAVLAGSITNPTSTTTAYTSVSDYRLKENIAPMKGALSVVNQLNPCTYDWIIDKSKGQGFIAHELQTLIPDCVIGEKDAVDEEGKPQYQSIDTSFLVATLTSAIQELSAQVTTLQATVETQATTIATLQNKIGA